MYNMFTQTGNAAVHKLAQAALKLQTQNGWSNDDTWKHFCAELWTLSTQSEFGEAYDTDVRECAWEHMFADT